MENKTVIVDNRFEQLLKEELKEFSTEDWELVDINWVLYEQLLLNQLRPSLGEKMVKMVVLGFRSEIPESDIDNWFRSHRFTYAMYYKDARTKNEQKDMLNYGDEGTISDIAEKLRDVFRNFESECSAV